MDQRMSTREIGIVMHGVTGRMGTNQHLVRSILAIMKQGGVQAGSTTLMPRPVLVGRNEAKLRALAEQHEPDANGQPLPWTTDLDKAIRDERFKLVREDCRDTRFFDLRDDPGEQHELLAGANLSEEQSIAHISLGAALSALTPCRIR